MHLRMVHPRHAARESYSSYQQVALDKGILEVDIRALAPLPVTHAVCLNCYVTLAIPLTPSMEMPNPAPNPNATSTPHAHPGPLPNLASNPDPHSEPKQKSHFEPKTRPLTPSMEMARGS